MELTVEELFAESIDVWVLRENATLTSLSFIDRIWKLLSRKARHQVRISLLFVAFAFGICSQGEHLFDKNLLCFVAFGTLSRSLELCPLLRIIQAYVQFNSSRRTIYNNNISNRGWFLFTCGFVARSVVWERFGSFCSRGKHWFTRTNFVLFETASRLLLCENCFTCTML